MTIILSPVEIDISTCEVIRSSVTNRVIGHLGEEGIVFWDRLANTRHVLTWEQIMQKLAAREQHRQADQSA